jgi:hypothetical protein
MDMEALLQSKGVIDFVMTNYAEEVRMSNRTAEKKRELLVGDVQALGLIKMNCTPTYQRMIKTSMSSKEAWTTLSKNFDESQPEGQGDLLEELLNIEFDERNGMDNYLMTHQELKQRLEASGVNMDPKLVVVTLLKGLKQPIFMMTKKLIRSMDLDYDGATRRLQSDWKEIKRDLEKHKVETRAYRDNVEPKAFIASLSETTLLEQVRALIAEAPGGSRFNRKRQRNPCTFCDKNNHPSSKCWMNPDSINYRPNWAKEEAKRRVNGNTRAPRQIEKTPERGNDSIQSGDPSSSTEVAAFVAKLLNGRKTD